MERIVLCLVLIPFLVGYDQFCWVERFPRKDFRYGTLGYADRTTDLVTRWLQECSEHSPCSKYGLRQQRLPDRVIDVGMEANPMVRLVESKQLEDQHERYICLSHCWGKDPMPIKTDILTIDRHKRGISIDSLPPTFKHAVDITRKLKCRYLWIDSLCIIQGDDADWQSQAKQMASIYRNSYLTIAAAAAAGPAEGLLFPTTPGYWDSESLDLDPTKIPFPVYVRLCLSFTVGHIGRKQNHNLLKRAWVLQERLLSPRVVYFGINEVAWECRCCIACECEPDLKPFPTSTYSPRSPFNPKAAFNLTLTQREHNQNTTEVINDVLQFWHHIVNTYSGLQLTLAKDRLPAIGGLASEVEGARRDIYHLNDSYIAGLWKNTFIYDVLWRRQRMQDFHAASFNTHRDSHNVMGGSDVGKDEYEKEYNERLWRSWRLERNNRNYRAPTWSWASLLVQVEYDRATNSQDLNLNNPVFATLVSYKCVPKRDANHYGELLETTHVVLRGMMVEVELSIELHDWYGTSIKTAEYRLVVHREGKDDYLIPFPDPDYDLESSGHWRTALKSGDKLYCLRIAAGTQKHAPKYIAAYALVLREKPEAPGVFERVGMLHHVSEVDSEEVFLFDAATTEQEVKIV